MSDILDKLHGDHLRIAQLLDLLEAQLDLVRDVDGETTVDYDLMRDIAHYFVTFPDHGHHAVEDRIFSAMETASPDLKKKFAQLREEHQILASLGQKFYALLDAVRAERLVEREKLVQATEQFLTLQRAHMNAEEGEIFPLARECLGVADIAAVEAEHAGLKDPLFGARVDDHYVTLHEAIVARA